MTLVGKTTPVLQTRRRLFQHQASVKIYPYSGPDSSFDSRSAAQSRRRPHSWTFLTAYLAWSMILCLQQVVYHRQF